MTQATERAERRPVRIQRKRTKGWSEDFEEAKTQWYRYQLTYHFCWLCGNPLVDKYHEIDADRKVVYCRDGTFDLTKPRPAADATPTKASADAKANS